LTIKLRFHTFCSLIEWKLLKQTWTYIKRTLGYFKNNCTTTALGHSSPARSLRNKNNMTRKRDQHVPTYYWFETRFNLFLIWNLYLKYSPYCHPYWTTESLRECVAANNYYPSLSHYRPTLVANDRRCYCTIGTGRGRWSSAPGATSAKHSESNTQHIEVSILNYICIIIILKYIIYHVRP